MICYDQNSTKLVVTNEGKYVYSICIGDAWIHRILEIERQSALGGNDSERGTGPMRKNG